MTTIISMKRLEKALERNLDLDIPTMIWGPPGVGKSDLVKKIARKRGYKNGATNGKPKFGFIDFRATLRDPVDLRGLPMVDGEAGTARWLPPSELPNAERDGDEGILFLDELPQAAPAMQTGCYSLVLNRYLGEYKLPPGWRIIAAGNRTTDRSGASRMLKALANRFAHFEVAPELDAWCAWATEVNLNPLVIAFLRFRPQFLHVMPEGEENCFPTPRAWAQVAKVADEQDESLRLALVSALVGEAAAIEFEAFVRIYSRVVGLIDKIFADPTTADVPAAHEPALMYAIATALGRRVTKQTMANAITYLKRLPKEFEIMGLVDAVRRDKDLKETAAFGNWFVCNADVLI